MDRLAATMKARGVVTKSETQVWASDEAAAGAFGLPMFFVDIIKDPR